MCGRPFMPRVSGANHCAGFFKDGDKQIKGMVAGYLEEVLDSWYMACAFRLPNLIHTLSDLLTII